MRMRWMEKPTAFRTTTSVGTRATYHTRIPSISWWPSAGSNRSARERHILRAELRELSGVGAEQADRWPVRAATREPRIAEHHWIGLERRERLPHVCLLVDVGNLALVIEAGQLGHPKRPSEPLLVLGERGDDGGLVTGVPMHGDVVDLASDAGVEEPLEPIEGVGIVAWGAAVVDARRDDLHPTRFGERLDARPQRRRLRRREVRLCAGVGLVEREEIRRVRRNVRGESRDVEGAAPHHGYELDAELRVA